MSVFSHIIRNSSNGHLYMKRAVIQANGMIDFLHFSKKADFPVPPKRPLTSYMFFCKENRKQLLEKNPDLTSTQQIKILAEKWNQLNVESRKPFELMARENTVLYGEEHKKFYENLSEEQKELLAKQKAEKRESRRLNKLKKALRDSGLPRPAMSGYQLFVQSQAGEKSETKQQGVFLKEVAEKWKKLSSGDKQSFEKEAESDKRRYLSEREQWRKKMLEEGHEKLLEEYERLKGKPLMNELPDSPKLKTKKSKNEEE